MYKSHRCTLLNTLNKWIRLGSPDWTMQVHLCGEMAADGGLFVPCHSLAMARNLCYVVCLRNWPCLFVCEVSLMVRWGLDRTCCHPFCSRSTADTPQMTRVACGKYPCHVHYRKAGLVSAQQVCWTCACGVYRTRGHARLCDSLQGCLCLLWGYLWDVYGVFLSMDCRLVGVQLFSARKKALGVCPTTFCIVRACCSALLLRSSCRCSAFVVSMHGSARNT